MGQNTAIEWAHHTFNAWTGCSKVSPGCEHCYAAEIAHRFQGTIGQWGPGGSRVLASEATWRQPLKWNRWAAEGVCYQCGGKRTVRVSRKDPTMIKCPACEGSGKMEPYRARVFCQSMSDVFEDWVGPVLNSNESRVTVNADGAWKDSGFKPTDASQWWGGDMESAFNWLRMDGIRQRLFRMIDATPHLDWLLLTKRPENIRDMWPEIYENDADLSTLLSSFHDAVNAQIASGLHGTAADQHIEFNQRLSVPYRRNVWLGTSVENQEQARRRIADILECSDLAPVLFLSCEPLLGPVDFIAVLQEILSAAVMKQVICPKPTPLTREQAIKSAKNLLDWFICGGESGREARPMHPDWARSLRDQCQAARVPFFFKQWGEYLPCERSVPGGTLSHTFWSDGRRARSDMQLSTIYQQGGFSMWHAGKKLAGGELDGRVWNEFPTVAEVRT